MFGRADTELLRARFPPFGEIADHRFRTALSATLGAAACWTTGDLLRPAGAVLMIANWPYTLLAIMPTNQLLEATASSGDGDSRERLVRWGELACR